MEKKKETVKKVATSSIVVVLVLAGLYLANMFLPQAPEERNDFSSLKVVVDALLIVIGSYHLFRPLPLKVKANIYFFGGLVIALTVLFGMTETIHGVSSFGFISSMSQIQAIICILSGLFFAVVGYLSSEMTVA